MKAAVIKRLQIFSGSHHAALAEQVAARLGIPMSQAKLQMFANGEVKCQLDESVRGADVFIFQAHTKSVSEAIMEQAIMIDAARRASARHITAVCPFFGYARQDRKSLGREPITAKLVVDIFAVAGANRIVSIDLHTGQIQGFFNGPFDHLIALPVLADHIQKKFGKKFVIVSPDAGRVKLAERYASRLGVDLAIVHKRRSRINHSEGLDVIGDVKGQQCVIIDDMIDTAGTVCAAASQLKEHGAANVAVAATHGLFSPPAAERLKESAIDYIAVTDTIPLDSAAPPFDNIEVISIVNLLAETTKAIFEQRSVSALFNGENQA